jgi:hypothetical protein
LVERRPLSKTTKEIGAAQRFEGVKFLGFFKKLFSALNG